VEEGMSASSYRQMLFQKIQNLKKEGFSEMGKDEQKEMNLFFQTEKGGRLLGMGKSNGMKSQGIYHIKKKRKTREKKKIKSNSVDKNSKKKIRGKKGLSNTGVIDMVHLDELIKEGKGFEKKKSRSRGKSNKSKKSRKSNRSRSSRMSSRSSKGKFSIRSLKKKKKRRSSEIKREKKRHVEEILETMDKELQISQSQVRKLR
jgi:hypothetical protein